MKFKKKCKNKLNVAVSNVATASFGTQVCIISGRWIRDGARCSLKDVTPFKLKKPKINYYFLNFVIYFNFSLQIVCQ